MPSSAQTSPRGGLLRRNGLLRGGLLRGGLVAKSWGQSIFDKLKDLSEQLIVASEGDDPSVTGRYPQQGQCVEFDGTGKIPITDNITDHILASGWFYPTSLDKSLVTKGSSRSPATNHDWDVFQNGSSIIFRGTSSDGSTELFSISCPALTINQWAFVECVWDGVDASISIGGVVCATLPVSGTLSDRFSASVGGEGSFSFEGKQSLIKVNDTVLNLDESSGTVAIDANDATNNGTLINGVTRVVDNTLPYSALNQVGYTEGTGSNGYPVGVNIPASTVTPTLDAYGNTLQHKGLVYPVQPVPVGSYALSLDGATQCVNFGDLDITSLSSISVAGWFKYSTGDDGGRIISLLHSGADDIRVFTLPDGHLYFGVDDGTAYTVNTTIGDYRDGGWHYFEAVFDGVDIQLTTELESTAKLNASFDFSTALGTLSYGCLGGGVFFGGSLSGVEILGLTKTNLAEGVGVTVHDISGNGNDAQIVGGDTDEEGKDTWGGSQDGYQLPHTNWKKGFGSMMFFDGLTRIQYTPAVLANQQIFRVSARVRVDAMGTNMVVFACGSSGMRIMANSGNTWSFGSADSGYAVTLGYHDLLFYSDGVDEFYYVDGNLAGSRATSVQSGTVNECQIGARDNGLRWVGGISHVKVNFSGSDEQWDHTWDLTNLNTDDSTGSANLDSSDGTLQNLRIPALDDGSGNDINGNVLTNPAVFHPNGTLARNNAETDYNWKNLSETGTPVPETVNMPVANITFAETNAQLQLLGNTDHLFRKDTSTTKKERAIGFEDTLTGDDLALAQEYTS